MKFLLDVLGMSDWFCSNGHGPHAFYISFCPVPGCGVGRC